MNIPRLLSAAEVAEIFQCHPKTVRTRLIREGLPTVRIGNRFRFRPVDVEAFQEHLAQLGAKEKNGNVIPLLKVQR